MRALVASFLLVALTFRTIRAENPSPEHLEFFEAKVRPILVEHCYECHSADAKSVKGGLRLDSYAAVRKGGDSGPAIVPHKPQDSPLIGAVKWQDFEMPPRGKLREEQVAVLVKWVELGAPWPEEMPSIPTATKRQPIAEDEAASYDWQQLQSQHWSFQSVRRPAVPHVVRASWPKNEIDFFVLARLEAAGLSPNAPAAPEVLVRRLYFDLIGLPPTPEQVATFVKSARRDPQAALETEVEELLASPHYGERWARHWLDVARYSDGYGGFLDAAAQPNAWRYRDWVVAVLNRDLPFNEFVRLQIAGDLIGSEHAVATGLLSLGPTYISDGGDPEATAQAMSETLDDRVDTLTRGLLGLTVSCARCHDHKFDPIPQLDYYSLAGVFKNTRLHEHPLAPPEAVAKFQAYQKQLVELQNRERTIKGIARKEERPLNEVEKAEIEGISRQIARLKEHPVEKYDHAHVLADAGEADMPLALRGDLRKPGPLAPRRFLRILAGGESPRFTHGSGRLELAEAMVNPANPLTARVLVNRVWRQHFGQGLVRTASNFGKLGEPPTHPELLDWLAAEFVEPSVNPHSAIVNPQFSPWSLKQLHRLMLTSATYQMSSAANPEAAAIDSDNRLLWRMGPRRLDVEAWRDAMLAVTGELDRTLGGPPAEKVLSSQRRTLYFAISRNGDRFEADRFLRLFDFPLPRATSEGRTSSVVPQQSLFLMNNEFVVARARALASRLADAADDVSRIDLAYRLLYARGAIDTERQLGLSFLQQAQPAGEDQQLSPWQQYAQVLLSANEFLHVE